MQAAARYELVRDWEQLPAGFKHLDCTGVSTDVNDNVYLLTRLEARVIVYTPEGRFVLSWGEGFFSNRPHGVTVGPDDTVYCVDEGSHCVYGFTRTGELLLTIGSKDVPADTGYDGTGPSIRGGPPFNRPTSLAVAPSGDLYVSDGYGNCKVHHFSPTGELLESWGDPGTGAGQFNLPHGIAVDAFGRVFVADRENDRIQIFRERGEFVEEWTDVQRPTSVAIDRDGHIHVAELAWRVGDTSPKYGQIGENKPCRVSVFEATGRLLARWGGPDGAAPGHFIAAHDIAIDSLGDVYVAEVTHSFAAHAGLVPPDSQTFQKFTRQH